MSYTPNLTGQLALMQELGELWYDYVGGDHHKDRDCHFEIVATFSYGEGPKFIADHGGYLDQFPRRETRYSSARPSFASFEEALADCIQETFAMFRRHYGDLPQTTIDRLKELTAQGMSARQGENSRSEVEGKARQPGPLKADAPDA